jgi:orotidine-5'-phosphate decarboxylase
MSPREAIERGSNFLVIGRPITKAKDINATLNEIYNSI